MKAAHPRRNASFGAGYSGKTEGNSWDDATNATIGKPKSKKASGASAGTSGTVSQQATIDKTMGKTAAYQKQEKQRKQTARNLWKKRKRKRMTQILLLWSMV